MKRFHVHLDVAELAPSIRFYSNLFGLDPVKREAEYAKWMLDEPRLNFAISAKGRTPGTDHLGLQVDSAVALAELGQRLEAAGGEILTQDGTTCCDARPDKAWTIDPQGTRRETFHTHGSATTYYAAGAACGDDKACAPDAVAVGSPSAPCRGPEANRAACTVAAPIVAVAVGSAAAADSCC
jgi:catechol 2,3-dioxygenase-like lactoylglutathione lyase family enzyme